MTRFRIKSDPIDGSPISIPKIPETDLERAKKLIKPSGKKSHARKFLDRAGKPNKPVEFFWLDRDPLTGEAI